MKDIVVLSADKNMEHTIKGLISRPQALGIRPVMADVVVHPRHDPGCAIEGVDFLSGFSEQYRHGLLIFDYEGSGRENKLSLDELQSLLNNDLNRSPWQDRAKAIVLYPELEAWIWSVSQHMDDVAGWRNRNPSLRRWLVEQGWLQDGTVKPSRPKEAFEAALREVKKRRSSSLYQQIAERVSLENCADAAFREFKETLQGWFPL